VDDTFAIFRTESDSIQFHFQLNSLHSSLAFTTEKEKNGQLPFLDVLIEKTNIKFLTSIYRKPTFTGQYIRWNSFSSKKQKTNLIGTLVHRALEICSKEKLEPELDNIRNILRKNGYPVGIINEGIQKKISSFKAPKSEGPHKCPVYLKIPWIGNVTLKFEKQIKSAVNRCFGSVKLRTVFSSIKMLPSIHKDVLPTLQRSNVVYKYTCHCDSVYVGRTSQRLEDRIKQHIPKQIRNRTETEKQLPTRECKVKKSNPISDSAIGLHLLQNKNCANNYNVNQFSILSTGRSSFHLATLEATFIKSLTPVLCRQKEFVYTLKIARF